MASNKQSLSDSLFGGGLTDNTGLFGKPTATAAAPTTKRQKRRQDEEEPPPPTDTKKTSQELWEERRKQYAPPDEEDDKDGPVMMDSFALVREQNTRIPEDVFAEEISSTVKTYGMAVVKNLIDSAILERLQERAVHQRDQICTALEGQNLTYNDEKNNQDEVRFQEVVVRCKGRMDARYRYDNMNQDPNLPCTNFWADHALLHKIIGMLLYGEEHTPKLVYAGWIFSFPGSDTQPWHQDGIPLFPGDGIAPNLPPYAINVFIPMQDQDGSLEAGPTEFVVGSHRMNVGQAMEATKTNEDTASSSSGNSPCLACPVLKRGDILLYDYRICHRGTSNLTHVATPPTTTTENDHANRDATAMSNNTNGGGRVRNILYLMYARPWFQEHLNFGTDKLFSVSGAGDQEDTMEDS